MGRYRCLLSCYMCQRLTWKYTNLGAEWYRGPGKPSALEQFMRFKLASPDVSAIYSFTSEKACHPPPILPDS